MSANFPNQNRGLFPWKVHPIWRGIGCAFLVIVPVISLGLSDILISNIEDPLPALLARTLILPGFGEAENFLGRIIIALLISIILFLILTVFGSIMYSILGGRKQEKQAARFKKDPFND